MESFLISGICRCCASEGPSKNLTNKYKWMGEEEVYSEMLKDCFDVTLHSTDDPATNGGICEVCITQLRNAYNFKKQVIVTEEFFKRRLLDGEHTFTADIKLEVDRGDCSASENDIDAADDLDSEMSVKSEQDEEKPKRRKVTARASTSRAAKKVKAEDAKRRRTRNEGSQKEDTKDKNLPEHQKLMRNLSTILNFSNATPFRDSHVLGYRCAYCDSIFRDPAELRTHTGSVHNKHRLAYKSGKQEVDNFSCRLDIYKLTCTVCNQPKESLKVLTEHLVVDHSKTFYTDVNDQIQPFVLMAERQESVKCCVCSNEYSCMKDLMQHMDVHYRNYICPVCGAGFINRGSLNKHEVVHTKETRQYACKHCKKEFSHEWKRRRHVKSVHEGVDEKRHVCQMCKGRFKTYYMRAQHMIQAHNVKPLPCELCDKTFPIRPMLALHHRKEHMKEKQYECVVCKIRFFEKNKLVSHQIIHTGEKNFSCDVCGKAFARRKTLTTHLKTHGSVINSSK